MPEIISTVILLVIASAVLYMEFVSPKEQKHRKDRLARQSARFERRSRERGDRRLRIDPSFVGSDRRVVAGRRASDKQRVMRVLESAPVARRRSSTGAAA